MHSHQSISATHSGWRNFLTLLRPGFHGAARRNLPAVFPGRGSAVLYFTCFSAKLDLMLATPGILAR
jgi:hypothetical protein